MQWIITSSKDRCIQSESATAVIILPVKAKTTDILSNRVIPCYCIYERMYMHLVLHSDKNKNYHFTREVFRHTAIFSFVLQSLPHYFLCQNIKK